MNNTVKKLIILSGKDTREKLALKAGCKLYLDARKATGIGLPTNSPLTSPWSDLMAKINNYTLTNLVGNYGNFGTDSDSDGLGDGLYSYLSGNFSLTNNIQTFCVTSANGDIDFHITPANANSYYACAYVRSTKTSVALRIADGSFTSLSSSSHTGSGNFEFLSVLTTSVGTTAGTVKAIDTNSSGWENISVKKLHMFNLTAIFGSGKEPTKAQMDYIVQKAIARYGYISTQTIQLANDAFPTNMAGTISSGVDISNTLQPFFAFDGIDDYLKLIDTSSLDITTPPLAVFTTIKTPESTAAGYVFAKNLDSSTNMQYGFFLQTDWTVNLYMEGALRKTIPALSPNTVYNIGFYWDGTNVKAFVNLVDIGSYGSYSGTLTNRSNVTVGARSHTGGTTSIFYHGKIGTITVYSGPKCTVSNILRAEKEISKKYI